MSATPSVESSVESGHVDATHAPIGRKALDGLAALLAEPFGLGPDPRRSPSRGDFDRAVRATIYLAELRMPREAPGLHLEWMQREENPLAGLAPALISIGEVGPSATTARHLGESCEAYLRLLSAVLGHTITGTRRGLSELAHDLKLRPVAPADLRASEQRWLELARSRRLWRELESIPGDQDAAANLRSWMVEVADQVRNSRAHYGSLPWLSPRDLLEMSEILCTTLIAATHAHITELETALPWLALLDAARQPRLTPRWVWPTILPSRRSLDGTVVFGDAPLDREGSRNALRQRRCLVVGDQGVGKSYLVDHQVADLARAFVQQGRTQRSACFPVVLDVRRMSAPEPPMQWSATNLAGWLGACVGIVDTWALELLEQGGRLHVVVDGLEDASPALAGALRALTTVVRGRLLFVSGTRGRRMEHPADELDAQWLVLENRGFRETPGADPFAEYKALCSDVERAALESFLKGAEGLDVRVPFIADLVRRYAGRLEGAVSGPDLLRSAIDTHRQGLSKRLLEYRISFNGRCLGWFALLLLRLTASAIGEQASGSESVARAVVEVDVEQWIAAVVVGPDADELGDAGSSWVDVLERPLGDSQGGRTASSLRELAHDVIDGLVQVGLLVDTSNEAIAFPHRTLADWAESDEIGEDLRRRAAVHLVALRHIVDAHAATLAPIPADVR